MLSPPRLVRSSEKRPSYRHIRPRPCRRILHDEDSRPSSSYRQDGRRSRSPIQFRPRSHWEFSNDEGSLQSFAQPRDVHENAQHCVHRHLDSTPNEKEFLNPMCYLPTASKSKEPSSDVLLNCHQENPIYQVFSTPQTCQPAPIDDKLSALKLENDSADFILSSNFECEDESIISRTRRSLLDKQLHRKNQQRSSQRPIVLFRPISRDGNTYPDLNA